MFGEGQKEVSSDTCYRSVNHSHLHVHAHLIHNYVCAVSIFYRYLRERPAYIAQPVDDAAQMRRENDSTRSQVPLLPETPGDQGGKVIIMDRLMNYCCFPTGIELTDQTGLHNPLSESSSAVDCSTIVLGSGTGLSCTQTLVSNNIHHPHGTPTSSPARSTPTPDNENVYQSQ